MIWLYVFLGIVFVVYQLWIHYLAVMNLAMAVKEKTITPLAYKTGLVVLWIGYLHDALAQFTVCLILGIPKELTVSTRISRIINTNKGWRLSFAIWFRDNWLKPFDRSGRHG